MMDCECDAGWNVEEDGYECYDGLSIWYRLGLIVYLILDTNVKDGYECNDGLWMWYRLGLIVYLIWIRMLRMGKNVMSIHVSNVLADWKNYKRWHRNCFLKLVRIKTPSLFYTYLYKSKLKVSNNFTLCLY